VVAHDGAAKPTIRPPLSQHNGSVSPAVHGNPLHNEHEALAHVDRLGKGISVVVTDLDMPEMGGLAFCAALRRDLLAVPIIGAAGVPSEARSPTVNEGLKFLDMATVFTKPHSAQTLLRAIDAAVRADAGNTV